MLAFQEKNQCGLPLEVALSGEKTAIYIDLEGKQERSSFVDFLALEIFKLVTTNFDSEYLQMDWEQLVSSLELNFFKHDFPYYFFPELKRQLLDKSSLESELKNLENKIKSRKKYGLSKFRTK